MIESACHCEPIGSDQHWRLAGWPFHQCSSAAAAFHHRSHPSGWKQPFIQVALQTPLAPIDSRHRRLVTQPAETAPRGEHSPGNVHFPQPFVSVNLSAIASPISALALNKCFLLNRSLLQAGLDLCNQPTMGALPVGVSQDAIQVGLGLNPSYPSRSISGPACFDALAHRCDHLHRHRLSRHHHLKVIEVSILFIARNLAEP